MLALAEPTLAQHTLQRTLTVDKSGSADFTTIQGADLVTKIILPVKLQLIGTQTVSVGTGAKLGLQFPIGADTDVIQFGVKASAATSYTITAFTPSTAVDVDFATFTPPSITNGDSFEFVVLSSQ